MNVNWIVLGIFSIVVIALVFYLIRKNFKDKKELTELLNNNYQKEEESELDNEE